MKLAVFGGTGRTGQHVVKHALDAGHEVVALARTPSKFEMTHDSLTVVQGDVLDENAVNQVVTGADAVISALAPPNNKPEFVMSRGVELILNAMKAHDVPRIVLATGAGVRDPKDNPKFIDHVIGFLLNVISKNVAEDSRRTVERIRNSDREWVVVRAPMLTDDPAKGDLTVGYVGDINPRLSREDFAKFMLEQVDSDTYLNQAPAISN